MDEQNKVRVVLYESAARIPIVDELARRAEVSRSELYRRAMREFIAVHTVLDKEAATHDHE